MKSKYIYTPDRHSYKHILFSSLYQIRQRYGLTLFENFLYLSNHHVNNNSVVKIHRYNSSVAPFIVKDSLRKPGALQVVHAVRQPGRELVLVYESSGVITTTHRGKYSLTFLESGVSLNAKP